MKLTDKRFWIWIIIIALMPVMMAIFTGFILVDTFSELYHYQNIELFLLWEIAYLVGGVLTYSKLHNLNWLTCAFFCWVIVMFPILNIPVYIAAMRRSSNPPAFVLATKLYLQGRLATYMIQTDYPTLLATET